jgi:hypothetical protein
MPSLLRPLKPEPGFVWITLLLFCGFGAWLIAKGSQFNSVGAQAVGALLVAAGIYYTIQCCLTARRASAHRRSVDDQATSGASDGRVSSDQLINISFHCGSDRVIEREWPAVPRLGEIVILDVGILVVSEVHWYDDPIGLPYVHAHLEPRPNAEK